jgi:Domain of unknown function (DUF4519)
MRQLKGGKVKESRKEKQLRREENLEIQKKLKTIVLPILGVVFLLICVYVFAKTRKA